MTTTNEGPTDRKGIVARKRIRAGSVHIYRESNTILDLSLK